MTARLLQATVARLTPALSVLLAACGLSPEEYRTIDAWLSCDECVHGERGAVRALGQRAVRTLERALTKGPPSERRDLMRRKFTGIHRSLGTAARVPSAQYVAELERNYVANYQKRAAVSLGDLRARSVLQDALTPGAVSAYRPDVVDVIRAVSASLDTARFRGTVTPATPGFGDTVIVRPPAAEPFTGDELAELDGSPFQASDLRLFVEPARLGFIAVGPPGPRVVTVHNVGTKTDSQYASLILRTRSDAQDRQMASCADFNCQIDNAPRLVAAASLPYVTFLSLWRTPPTVDTMDLIRIQAAAELPVTAQLDWSPSANLDLRWMHCVTRLPVGNNAGATAAPRESTSVVIPQANCWLLLALLASHDTVPVIARLRIRSP